MDYYNQDNQEQYSEHYMKYRASQDGEVDSMLPPELMLDTSSCRTLTKKQKKLKQKRKHRQSDFIYSDDELDNEDDLEQNFHDVDDGSEVKDSVLQVQEKEAIELILLK